MTVTLFLCSPIQQARLDQFRPRRASSRQEIQNPPPFLRQTPRPRGRQAHPPTTPPPKKPYGKWFWVCVEKPGWLDLRNPVSGTFLGHDSRGGIIAERKHHRDWEYLCFRRHPSGGYTILVKHRDSYWKGSVLGKAALGREDGRSLVETEEEGGGAQWEFEEVYEVGGARSFLFVRWIFESLQASNLSVASLSLSLSHGPWNAKRCYRSDFYSSCHCFVRGCCCQTLSFELSLSMVYGPSVGLGEDRIFLVEWKPAVYVAAWFLRPLPVLWPKQ